KAQELPLYERCGFARIAWVEPHPKLAAALVARGLDVQCCAVSSADGTATLHVTKWSQRSSLLAPTAFDVRKVVPVATKTLDSLDTDGCNVLVVDVQGAELDVVSSGSLARYDLIVVECRQPDHYQGQPAPGDVLAAMPGFVEVATVDHHNGVV